MVKNSQKKGSLPKGGEPNGGVKNPLQKDCQPTACNVAALDYEKLFFNQTGLCPYRSKNRKAFNEWVTFLKNEM